jgi:hypothetical protein
MSELKRAKKSFVGSWADLEVTDRNIFFLMRNNLYNGGRHRIGIIDVVGRIASPVPFMCCHLYHRYKGTTSAKQGGSLQHEVAPNMSNNEAEEEDRGDDCTFQVIISDTMDE